MTTREALIDVFSRPVWYDSIPSGGKSLFLSKQAAYDIKKRFKRGRLSMELAEHILNYHGYRKNETTWSK